MTTLSLLSSVQILLLLGVTVLLVLILRQLRSMQRASQARFDAAAVELDQGYQLLHAFDPYGEPPVPRQA